MAASRRKNGVIAVSASPELISAVDEVRGNASRSAICRELLWLALCNDEIVSAALRGDIDGKQ